MKISQYPLGQNVARNLKTVVSSDLLIPLYGLYAKKEIEVAHKMVR